MERDWSNPVNCVEWGRWACAEWVMGRVERAIQ